MVHEVEAILQPDVHLEGSVCPGDWIYHKYEHVGTTHQDAIFNLELHTGALHYTLRPDRPAITLVRTNHSPMAFVLQFASARGHFRAATVVHLS